MEWLKHVWKLSIGLFINVGCWTWPAILVQKPCFSSKLEYTVAICYRSVPEGKAGKEIYIDLTNVWGFSAPSYAQVKFWVGEFKWDRTSLEDESRSEYLFVATNEEKYVCCERNVVEIAKNIRKFTLYTVPSLSTILHGHLGMRKLTALRVLKFLNNQQMNQLKTKLQWDMCDQWRQISLRFRAVWSES